MGRGRIVEFRKMGTVELNESALAQLRRHFKRREFSAVHVDQVGRVGNWAAGTVVVNNHEAARFVVRERLAEIHWDQGVVEVPFGYEGPSAFDLTLE
jgi:hypothetical protein